MSYATGVKTTEMEGNVNTILMLATDPGGSPIGVLEISLMKIELGKPRVIGQSEANPFSSAGIAILTMVRHQRKSLLVIEAAHRSGT